MSSSKAEAPVLPQSCFTAAYTWPWLIKLVQYTPGLHPSPSRPLIPRKLFIPQTSKDFFFISSAKKKSQSRAFCGMWQDGFLKGRLEVHTKRDYCRDSLKNVTERDRPCTPEKLHSFGSGIILPGCSKRWQRFSTQVFLVSSQYPCSFLCRSSADSSWR